MVGLDLCIAARLRVRLKLQLAGVLSSAGPRKSEKA